MANKSTPSTKSKQRPLTPPADTTARGRPREVSLAQLRTHEPETLITFRVSALSQLLGRLVEASVSRELGLSSRQWRVLVILYRLGEATSGDVTRASRLDHSQVSRASYELADKGLVAMRTDLQDRRRQLLSVTPAGVGLLRRGIVGSQYRQRRLRSRLGDADYDAFGRVLSALTDEAHLLLQETRTEGLEATVGVARERR
jgi:DNA-binding MarR family transcriptional regulator